MKSENFSFKGEEGLQIYVYKWSPEGEVKGAVQIAHGMAETAIRYEGFAKVLTDDGYVVYANDHRGHGNTAKSLDNVGILGSKDGFELMVKDVHTLLNLIKEENKGKEVFLFGHSMGSFVSQQVIIDFGSEYKGAVLSGTNGKQGISLNFGRIVANMEVKKHGRNFRSQKLNDMSFGSYNNAFKPNRTGFDWLSSDDKEVDKYINDPYCGGIFTAGFYQDLLKGLMYIENNENLKSVPKDLPILLISGEKDPVSKGGKGVKKIFETYKSLGVKDIDMKLYKDKRHELLNESNKDEVMKYILNWFNNHK